MLRIYQSSSAKAVKAYYDGELLTRADYYGQESEGGIWGGKGAAILGLEGEVKRQDFHMLCDNRRPDNWQKLNPRDSATRKVGYDFTFNAPKSVSLAACVLLDSRVEKVFQETVRETMSHVEKQAHVRVRKGGAVGVKKTGNLLWSEFVHYETRPGEDGLSDPSLHCHVYVQNTSYSDGRFYAGEFFPIIKNAVFYQAIFHSKLAEGLKLLGYEVENKPFSFEVAGIGEDNIRRFSRRTQEIEELAQKLGLSGNGDAMAKLGALTRRNKRAKRESVNQLAEWRSRLDWSGLSLENPTITQPSVMAKQAVALALESVFERRSVFPLRRVIAEALQNSLGDCTYEEILNEVKTNSDLVIRNINGIAYATTREVLTEERSILGFLKETKSGCIPMLAWYREKSTHLDDDQRAAVEAIMHTRDRVICIQGKAGTGKTTMMSTAIAAMEAVDETVFTFAPTSQAAHQVLRDEGFQNSETVQQLLVNTELQEKIRGKVMWIDEAGLLSTKELKKLIDVANEKNARLVFSGDYAQHHSVGRGDGFRLVCESGLVTVQETRSIYRQRSSTYKKAVEALSAGDAVEALTILDDMGAIKEVDGLNERLQATAMEYMESLGQYKSVLVVSPTHLEGRLVTNEIRKQLGSEGKLGNDEICVPIYRNRNLTEAQRKMTLFYSVGDVVRFHQNSKGGFTKADIVRVVGKDDEGILVQKNGETGSRRLDLSSARHFGLFEESSISLSVGDRVRITRNATSTNGKRMFNGNIHEVTGLGDGSSIVLDGKYLVDPQGGLLDYGYVTTSHSSQGKTADKVIVSQSGLSFDAASLEQIYVSVSRGRDAAAIFTDSRSGLLESVRDSAERMLAVELEEQCLSEEEEIQSAIEEADAEELELT